MLNLNKKRGYVEIQFLGATQEVTGSCFLLKAGNDQILVDCGLIQGRPADELRNFQPFPFYTKKIQAVVITHAHLDHIGRLPLLVKAGFKGKIYTQKATIDLARVLLLDAAFLSEKDAEWENKHLKKNEALHIPLYTREDVEKTLPYFVGVDYHQKISISEHFDFRLQDAGHILGSAIAEVWLNENGLERKLVFSGDLGNRGAPIIRDPSYVEFADLLILESTYGDRNHRSWDSTWNELAAVIQTARHHKGNILIPAFAVGRTQEILYLFNRHYHDWGIDRWQLFLDSPMAIAATEIYEKYSNLYNKETLHQVKTEGNPLNVPNLHMSETVDDSMRINQIRSGAIIIAGSGMCNGGRIRHHLRYNISNHHNHVLIVGFQAAGTPGRALVDGVKSLKLWGESYPVEAKIHTIGGLSAHADQSGLIEWYKGFKNQPPVVLIHGEPEAIEKLADVLHRNKAPKVWKPTLGFKLDLRKILSNK